MNFARRLRPIQAIAGGYALLTVVSALLLFMPFSHQPGQSLAFIDALFVSASAISVTGLTTVNVSETLNLAGQIILLVTIQLGGVGVMTLGTMIWVFLGKKVGLRGRLLIQLDQNQTTLAGLVKLIRNIFAIVLVIEAIGAVILGVYFLREYVWYEALYMGLFHAVTAFTHAGFDLFGNSLLSFRYDYVVNLTVIALIFCGAVGFPVLIELINYPRERKLSLHSKVSLTIYLLLWAIGTLFFFAVEYNYSLQSDAWHEKILISLFQSITTRSTGLSTLDVTTLQLPTLLFMSFNMFIGASPSSCGGGVRTTTLATVYLAVKSYAKGTKEVSVFGRELDPFDVRKAFVVMVFGVSLVIFATLILSITEPFSLELLLFEISSAFGTCGLSVGLSEQLTHLGKTVLIVLMLTGRIGFGTILLVMSGNNKKVLFHYPKERIIIG
ncbi:TrkH family potassium uptake protein [Numidum massiliense]|uniref:TrkH family potassium uptake protein n=1 Tax=Numidum massiliense TaxID=1522315 RepID=UPI0006D55FC2|nr:potassium transporter TrkG [Numidum massiliense]